MSYREDLPNRVYEATGDLGAARGRVTAPIMLPPTPARHCAPPPTDPKEQMSCLCDAACKQLATLERLANLLEKGSDSSIWNLMREHSVFFPGRGAKSFWTPPAEGSGGTVEVPGTGSSPLNVVTVASVTIPDGYEGTLMRVGFDAVPQSANDSVKWQLRIGDQAQPLLGSGNFYCGFICNPQPFWLEVPSGKLLSLIAINTSATILKATGVLIGFMKPLHNP